VSVSPGDLYARHYIPDDFILGGGGFAGVDPGYARQCEEILEMIGDVGHAGGVCTAPQYDQCNSSRFVSLDASHHENMRWMLVGDMAMCLVLEWRGSLRDSFEVSTF